ncbi:hypothetical protein ACWGI8_44210 [Streptomyces sp. NPDC054841]
MSVVKTCRARPLVIAALVAGLVAGAVTVTSTTDVFTTASAPASAAADRVALAGANDRPKGRDRGCESVDRITPFLIREGWDSTPEKVMWRNGASTQQQHQYAWTKTFTARGMLTGSLEYTPAAQKKAKAAINKKNKQSNATRMLGFELELSASVGKTETLTYNIPARSAFIAKRGIWKQTWGVNRYQRWSNCQERWSHVGNFTGVGEMNYTSSKKLFR